MSIIKLCDALYTPFENIKRTLTVDESAAEIERVLLTHIEAIGRNQQHTYADAGHHYFCSTILDTVFTSNAFNSKKIAALPASVPQSFSSAYECACWGYLMRYHLKQKSEQKYFAISILDVNAMELTYWSNNAQWGQSGFGVSTLFFKIEDDGQDEFPIYTGAAKGGNNIIGFASFAKSVMGKAVAKAISLPFFPDSMSIPVRNVLKFAEQLTEYHAEIGHAFGSDPWIAFIKDKINKELDIKSIVFGSLALRGYFCFADLKIAENVNVQLMPVVN